MLGAASTPSPSPCPPRSLRAGPDPPPGTGSTPGPPGGRAAPTPLRSPARLLPAPRRARPVAPSSGTARPGRPGLRVSAGCGSARAGSPGRSLRASASRSPGDNRVPGGGSRRGGAAQPWVQAAVMMLLGRVPGPRGSRRGPAHNGSRGPGEEQQSPGREQPRAPRGAALSRSHSLPL